MGRYENIVVLSPDISKEDEDELLKRIQANLEKAGATTVRFDDWAVRKLAYPIKKKDRGITSFSSLIWMKAVWQQ